MGTRKPLVVYIIEDDATSRNLLSRLLTSWGYRPETFASAEDFLKIRLQRPSCLLLDLGLPGLDGLGLQDALLERGESPTIIFLTSRDDVPSSVRAIKNGAYDFLLKPCAPQALHQLIAAALEKDRLKLEHESVAKELHARWNSLTTREKEVLPLIVTGRLNKQIASSLKITERTVKAHRAKIMQKMQAATAAQLATVYALVHIHTPAHIVQKDNTPKHRIVIH